jgi:hypothetical protein
MFRYVTFLALTLGAQPTLLAFDRQARITRQPVLSKKRIIGML